MKRTWGNWVGGVSAVIFLFGLKLVAVAQTGGGGTGNNGTGGGGTGNSGIGGGGTGNSGGNSINLSNPLGNVQTVNDALAKIGAFMLALAVPICGIMVLWGGFQMMTAAGDPKKFSDGRQTLFYAAIGFVIVLFASSVVPLIKSILGG